MIIALWQEVLKISDWNHWGYFSFYSVDFVSALPVKPVPPLHHAWSLSPTTHLCLNFILLIMVQLTEQGIILTKNWAKQIGLRQTLILLCYTPKGLLAEEHEKPSLCPDSYLIPTFTWYFWMGLQGILWQFLMEFPKLKLRCNYLKLLVLLNMKP